MVGILHNCVINYPNVEELMIVNKADTSLSHYGTVFLCSAGNANKEDICIWEKYQDYFKNMWENAKN